MNEQKSAQEQDLPALEPERARHDTSMFLSETALLAPSFVGSPAPAEHLPFVGWLIAALRPRTVVDLAAADPTLFFGACQAVAHLKSPTSCHLVGAAAPATEMEAWVAHLNRHYGGFADFTPLDAESAIKRFDKGAIDLIILHGSSRHAWMEWAKILRNRLSSRGVVVLHGYGGDDPELLDAFGSPGMVFQHADGLAVIAAVEEAPSLLDHLFRLGAGREHVLALFERLGQGCARAADAMLLSSRDEELRRSSFLLEDTREQAGLLAARLVARESEIRDLQVRLEHIRQRDAERHARLCALQGSSSDLQEHVQVLEEDLAQANRSLESKRRQLKRTAAGLLASEEKCRALKGRVKELQTKAKELESLFRKEQRAKRRVRDRLDEVLNSRAWRASAPLRELATRLKRPR